MTHINRNEGKCGMSLPPIDRAIPDNLKTATFALG